MKTGQMTLFPERPEDPFFVVPGDWARPGLVERSVAAMNAMPDAARQLRTAMAERIESIRAIDLVYRNELNEWAATTRERLWLEYFTAQAILDQLQLAARATRPNQV